MSVKELLAKEIIPCPFCGYTYTLIQCNDSPLSIFCTDWTEEARTALNDFGFSYQS